MSVFTKSHLKQLYEEEINIKKNKCVEQVVQYMKRLVFTEAKQGRTSASYKHTDDYYNDEWVKTQILEDLKRAFIDSIINVNSNSYVNSDGLAFHTIKISIDWA
jgi:TPR repeat protein